MNENQRAKERGQSLVLVAAALVILVIFVAITVDVSSAYYFRRTAQNGADGAALGGVRQLATQINNRKKLDGLIQAEMNLFAEKNGIPDTDGIGGNAENANVDGWYTDSSGNRLDGEPMVGSGKVPAGAYGIEAITYVTAPTYFGGVFGFDGYALDARAVSLVRRACSNDCVVPIATEKSALFTGQTPPVAKLNQCFNIWNGVGEGNFGWLNWTWQESVCDNVTRPCPDDCKVQDCDSGCLSYNLDPDHCASGYIQVGDWVAGTTGVKSSDNLVLDWLDYYLGLTDGISHTFTIIVYDGINGETGCSAMSDPFDPTSGGLHYKVAGFAEMQILGYQLPQGQGQIQVGNDGSLCETVGLDPGGGFRITAEFREWVLEWNTSDACYDPYSTLRSSPIITE